ncbi:hypothetical protein [Embleya sp. AB8]|uniref:hypothetical protein n=1 Tax=Embleya sp. AB8 TaxID=3156304 RepID=UPI003C796E94
MAHPELAARPRWRRTGNVYFPVAAAVDGTWWILRINGFPDHPPWTLFVGGVRRFDLDDLPSGWKYPSDPASPVLETRIAEEVLTPIRGFVAYGSEVGRPCDNPFCCG